MDNHLVVLSACPGNNDATLVEYLFSLDYQFRNNTMWKCLNEVAAEWTEDRVKSFLQLCFARLSTMSGEVKQSIDAPKKVVSLVRTVVPKVFLKSDTFLALAQLMSHPYLTETTQDLQTMWSKVKYLFH